MEVSGRTEGFEDGMASESESIFLLMGENGIRSENYDFFCFCFFVFSLFFYAHYSWRLFVASAAFFSQSFYWRKIKSFGEIAKFLLTKNKIFGEVARFLLA